MAEVGEWVRATLSYAQPGASIQENVFFWEVKATADDEEVFDALSAWAVGEWGDAWATFAADAAEIIGLAAEIVEFVAGVLVVARTLGDTILAVAGTQAFDQQAAAVAATIFAPTARPKSRGRKFIPSVSETSVDEGLFDAALLTSLAALCAIYVAELTGTGGVVLTPGVPSTVTSGFLSFTGDFGFDDIPDYRRTRRPDRGS